MTILQSHESPNLAISKVPDESILARGTAGNEQPRKQLRYAEKEQGFHLVRLEMGECSNGAKRAAQIW